MSWPHCLQAASMAESPLLQTYLEQLREASAESPVLDLACGSGRNALWLASQEVPVVCADIRQNALDEIALAASNYLTWLTPWQVDLEAPGSQPLAGKHFGAVLVFRYLHRPLMLAIAEAIMPGGLVIYETFTTAQPRFGRPTNPDYLLQPGELPEHFQGWEVMHEYEGVIASDTTGNHQAVAQLVARKPLG